MTSDEARSLLGVDPGIDPKALRRAYLRKLKSHRPDRDAAAFQRLRQAYELLQPSAGLQEPPARTDRLDELDDPDEVVALQEAMHACHTRLMTAGPEGVLADARAALERSLRHGTAPRWFPTSMMELLLALVEVGAVVDAAALEVALAAWFERSGAELRLLDGFGVVQWALVRELGSLPDAFDLRVRRWLAGALARWDFDWEWAALAHQLVQDPKGTVATRAALVIHAPGLADLAEPLDELEVFVMPEPWESEREEPHRATRPIRWGRTLAVLGCVAGLLGVGEWAGQRAAQKRLEEEVMAMIVGDGGELDLDKLQRPRVLDLSDWKEAGYILSPQPGRADVLLLRHCFSATAPWSVDDCVEVQFAMRNSLRLRCDAAVYSLELLQEQHDGRDELLSFALDLYDVRCGDELE